MIKIQCIVLRGGLQRDLLNPKLQIRFCAGITPTETFQDWDVWRGKKHEAGGRKTISTSSAYFLAIVLERFRHIKMYDLQLTISSGHMN